MINYIRVINNCFHKVVDTEINEQNGAVEEETKAISNFYMEIIKRMKNEETNETEDLIKFTSKHKHVKSVEEVIELKNLSSVKKLKEFLSKKYSCFNFIGNDNDLEMIKEFINKNNFKEVNGTNTIGVNEVNNKKFFVNNGVCLDSNLNPSEEFILSSKNTINLKNTFSNDLLNQEDCEKLKDKLFDFNIPEITFTAISAACSVFLNPILTKYDIKMPNIAFFGEPGGAKSETKDNIIKPIFQGFDDEIAADIKPFGTYKYLSETNIIPLSIEEYKVWTISKQKQELIRGLVRSSYDKHVTTKGHADQTVTKYKIKTPILITGESSFEEKAGKERTIILQFAKKFHNKDRKANFLWLKRNKKYLNKMGNSLLKESMNIDEKLLIENYYLIVEEITGRFPLPDRLINNIAVVLLGYNVLFEIFQQNKVKLPNVKTALKYILKSQNDFNLGGKDENNGFIEDTLEIFTEMISNGFLPQESHHYLFLKDGKYYLSLKNTFPEFTRYLKQYNIQGEFETRKQPFERLLVNSKYFVAKKRENNKRYIVLDAKAIKDADIDFSIENENEGIPDTPESFAIPLNVIALKTLTSGDFQGNNVESKKYNLSTKNLSDVKNKIFIDDDEKVYIPEFTNEKVYNQCINNLTTNTKKLFEIGDNYRQKAFENQQMKLY